MRGTTKGLPFGSSNLDGVWRVTNISMAQARMAIRKRPSRRLNQRAELQMGSQSHLKQSKVMLDLILH